MIEAVVRDYLAGRLGVPVLLEAKGGDGDGGSFVLLERTGGGEREHVRTATFAIQSHAPSMYGAAELNERVKAAMAGIAELPSVSHAGLNADYNFTDTEKKGYRYQAIYDLVYFDE